ncbi:putative lysine decarboxylase [uncultured archaeon]|nr:putative lysine decarboxylase [uncultured archaeon]
MQVAVVGGGECSPEAEKDARTLGRLLAEAGYILLCGGKGGVMEAVCAGVRDAGGHAVGILPGEKNEGNMHISISIATGMGQARNVVVVKSADAVIALPGVYGTLSEIALALKMKKPVIGLHSWEVPGMLKVNTPQEAAEMLGRI